MVSDYVNGHLFLPIGGHEIPHWWPSFLPAGGCQSSPPVAIESPHRAGECAEPELHLGVTPRAHSARRFPSPASGISAEHLPNSATIHFCPSQSSASLAARHRPGLDFCSQREAAPYHPSIRGAALPPERCASGSRGPSPCSCKRGIQRVSGPPRSRRSPRSRWGSQATARELTRSVCCGRARDRRRAVPILRCRSARRSEAGAGAEADRPLWRASPSESGRRQSADGRCDPASGQDRLSMLLLKEFRKAVVPHRFP